MDELNEVKETLKDLFRKAINNAKDGDEKGQWITINGTHVFIPEGKTAEDVIKEKGWKEKGEGKEKSDGNNEDKHGFKKDKDSGYYMKDLSDGTSVYVEKKEGGQGEKEPFYLEATHFDKDGKEIAKKQYHYDSMDGMFSKIDRDFGSKDTPSEGKKGYSLSKEYKNHVQFEGDKESGGYPRKIHKDLESAKKFYEYKKEGQEGAEEENLKRSGKRGIPVRDYPVIVKNPLGDGFVVATHGLAQKHDLKEVYPVNREDNVKNGLSEIIKNCKPETKEDLKVLKGLKDILEEQ